MILDKLALFDDRTIMGGAGSPWIVGTNLSVNSYDTGAAGVPAAIGANPLGAAGQPIGGPLLHDIGRGRPILLLAQINTTATSAGAPTLQVTFVQADTGDLVTNINPLLLTPAAIPLATLVAGYRFPFKTLPGKISRRFIGLQWIVGVAAYTGGTVTAGMTVGTDDRADVLGGVP
jgi:hypothetical protein